MVAAELIAAIAEDAITRSRLGERWPPPDELAVALGYRVLRGYQPAGAELKFARAIMYWPSRNHERSVRIAHALAHALLSDAGIEHTEADAWALTQELAKPDWAALGLAPIAAWFLQAVALIVGAP